VNPGQSVSASTPLVSTSRWHPGTGLETVRAAVTPVPDPESLNAAATPQRGAGAYGMAAGGPCPAGFIARRRHRVLNASD